QIDLDWDDNTESDLDSYNVYRGGSQIATGVTVSSYSDTGLSASTQYCYTATAVDTSSNESTESSQACATTQSGTGPGDGDGLTGDYYDNMDFTSHALTRVDPTVNFDWGSGSPDPSMGADTFSVRWTGQVEPLYSETYTFRTRSDDGVRLWVNGQSVIDNWTDHAPTYDSGTISLSAGTKYDVQLDYYENGGGAVIELYWSSASQAEEIVPQSQLYSGGGGDTTPPAAPTGLTATAVSDTQIDLDWDDNAESDLDSYNVYRGGSQIASGVTTSSYSDTGLSASTQYCYTVTAVDTSANESAESAQDCATTQSGGGGEPVSLLEWEFDDSVDKSSVSSSYTDGNMQGASITLGPGFPVSGNSYYQEDAFGTTNAETSSLDPDNYFTWTVAPASGKQMSLSSIMLGAFDQEIGDDYYVELRWSSDGFGSYETVTLSPGNPLSGNGLTKTSGTQLTGDLSGFAGLQSTSDSVEFRFYIWDVISQYHGTGLGKLGDTAVDVRLEGTAG
ncbi:MAG: PA14 domain-containing protein, partial [Candidatus Brocadiia bacterium]